jgi:hypothetical protein
LVRHKRTVAKNTAYVKKKGASDRRGDRLGHAPDRRTPSPGPSPELGEQAASKFYEFIRREPRVVEACSTIGSSGYFVVLDEDLQRASGRRPEKLGAANG